LSVAGEGRSSAEGRGRLALVTGAASGLGRGLVAALGAGGWQVRELGGDASEARALAGADVVFHLAPWQAGAVGDGFDDPVGSHVANAEGTLALLEAARAAQVRRIVYASAPQAAEPTTPHAVQLHAGELYCGLYHRLHALETVSLRYPHGLSESDAIRAMLGAVDAEHGLGTVVVAREGRS